MVFNLIAGVLIFGYAAWSIIRYVRKTRQGKCAACSLSESCQSACQDFNGKLGSTILPPSSKQS
ncbi:FeoB-associated Cys-rich membrane protein [Paenibacillus cremeus]|uniref:FeoB-associated Cys-rich membrane protein n=1 Tax=Paenibacillus cremeus TaxID=2163881 RepID=A0A559JGK4_9BACL|nr:FeoB-associated Cys-rich membrane protein [Paenibacillus cremeus]TVX99002.1 FeoB-associated Cys-rich membrane protein [Paenibacillus cremeus]